MGCKVQQLELAAHLGVYCHHGESSLCQRSCLVEHHRVYLREYVKIVGSLHQYALARSTAQSAKEGQWHTYDQCTRTAHHEEHKSPIEPQRECSPECCHQSPCQSCRHECLCQRHDDGYSQCQSHHYRGVDACKARDECLTLRLMLASLFHQSYNL